VTVAFLDLGAAYEELREEIDLAYRRVMDSGWYVLGEELEEFEHEWAAYCCVKHCVGVANGLDALHLTLRAMGVGAGDEVVVPSNTYIATWLAVSACGANPVAADPAPGSFTLTAESVDAVLTPRTKAVIPVHLYGFPADMDSIVELAHGRGVRVLEDAAQSHGATYKMRKCGGLGDAAAFSFYPGKNLGAFGDAGALTTDDDEIADRVRLLRNYGSRVKYQNETRGANSRLDPLQAAFLRVKLRHLDEWNARRAEVADTYARGLAGLPGIVPPSIPDDCVAAWHLYVVRCNRRADVIRKLDRAGIGTLIHYPVPPHLSEAYADLDIERGTLPVAERLADEVLSLPMGPHLTSDDQERVIKALTSACS
jgi:dTDP-4-amino-4,6-dideoxygalactose transaminase